MLKEHNLIRDDVLNPFSQVMTMQCATQEKLGNVILLATKKSCQRKSNIFVVVHSTDLYLNFAFLKKQTFF